MDEDLYKQEREELQQHLSLLETQKMENHKMWDSQILALSSLALGLSFTLVKDFIDLCIG
jgi:hypothetical protein|tara:strand:+ start:4410 stop:4589 length:180 start_codon:yes stop_codon:yes gene_type:complete